MLFLSAPGSAGRGPPAWDGFHAAAAGVLSREADCRYMLNLPYWNGVPRGRSREKGRRWEGMPRCFFPPRRSRRSSLWSPAALSRSDTQAPPWPKHAAGTQLRLKVGHALSSPDSAWQTKALKALNETGRLIALPTGKPAQVQVHAGHGSCPHGRPFSRGGRKHHVGNRREKSFAWVFQFSLGKSVTLFPSSCAAGCGRVPAAILTARSGKISSRCWSRSVMLCTLFPDTTGSRPRP